MPRYYLSMSAVVLTCFVVAGVFRACQVKPVEFDSLADVKKQISKTLHVTNINHALVVSIIPLTKDQAQHIADHVATTADMTGKVIITKRLPGVTSPLLRQWGKVQAVGDPELLDLIESAH